jgi:hypothetical protein
MDSICITLSRFLTEHEVGDAICDSVGELVSPRQMLGEVYAELQPPVSRSSSSQI